MRGMIILGDMFTAAVERETTGIGKAKAFSRAFFDYAARYPEHYRLLMAARSRRFMSAIRSGEVEGARDFGNQSLEMITLLMDAIKLGKEDGTVREDIDPIETAVFLSMACEGAVQMTPEWEMLLQMNNLSIDRYYEHSLDVLLHGIAVDNEK
jgi:AcrR family transcriptional regulator